MSATRPIVVYVQPTAFAARKAEAAERGRLELAADIAKAAKDAAARAESLFKTASGSDPGPRAQSTKQAVAEARIASARLAEIMEEFDGL